MMSEQSELIAGDTSPAAVVVSRVMAHPVKRVCQVLMAADGAEALLGPGAAFGGKGQSWTSTDGRSGVVRTLHPLEELRFTCRKEDGSRPSMVQIDLAPDGDQTTLTLTHSNLQGAEESLPQRWQDALGRIEACLAA